MRPQTRVIVVVILAGIAIGSHLLLERTGRTLTGNLSAILIAMVALGLVIAVMRLARRR